MTNREAYERDCDELEQYREIGTVEECKEAASIIKKAESNELAKVIDEWIKYKKIGTVEECREAVGLKKYFDKLYGTGLEIANWHLNGDLEPFDNFYELGLKNFDGMD